MFWFNDADEDVEFSVDYVNHHLKVLISLVEMQPFLFMIHSLYELPDNSDIKII